MSQAPRVQAFPHCRSVTLSRIPSQTRHQKQPPQRSPRRWVFRVGIPLTDGLFRCSGGGICPCPRAWCRRFEAEEAAAGETGDACCCLRRCAMGEGSTSSSATAAISAPGAVRVVVFRSAQRRFGEVTGPSEMKSRPHATPHLICLCFTVRTKQDQTRFVIFTNKPVRFQPQREPINTHRFM